MIEHYSEVPNKYRLFGILRPFRALNPNHFTALFPIVCTLGLSIYMIVKISIYKWYQATKNTTYWNPYGRVDVELQIIQMWFWFVVFFCQGFQGIWAWVYNDYPAWKRYYKTYKLRYIATAVTALYWLSFLFTYVIQFFDQNYNYLSTNTVDPITPLAQLLVVIGAFGLDSAFLFLTYVYFVKRFYLKMYKIDNEIEKFSLLERQDIENQSKSNRQKPHSSINKQSNDQKQDEEKFQLQ